jgi:hypothetical protein
LEQEKRLGKTWDEERKEFLILRKPAIVARLVSRNVSHHPAQSVKNPPVHSMATGLQ